MSLASITVPDKMVEPREPRNLMLAHLLDDYDPEAHRRAEEKAEELFRTIVRRATLPPEKYSRVGP